MKTVQTSLEEYYLKERMRRDRELAERIAGRSTEELFWQLCRAPGLNGAGRAAARRVAEMQEPSAIFLQNASGMFDKCGASVL